MSFMRLFPVIIWCLSLFCPTTPLQAEDWPGWRGPKGDGTSLEKNIPTKWSQKDNIAWKVEVPGIGHASPVILGDSVFLVTCDEKTRERILLCLDRRTGRELWRRVVIRAPLEAIHRLNSRASSTPTTDGMHVYVSFLEPSGYEIAQHRLKRRKWGFKERTANRKAVKKGDILLVYVDGKRENAGKIIAYATTSHGPIRITSSNNHEDLYSPGETSRPVFDYFITFSSVQYFTSYVHLKNLRHEMSFVSLIVRSGGVRLQSGCVKITAGDFAKIIAA